MKLEASDRSLISETPYLMVKVPGGRMHTYGGLKQDEWNLKLLIDPLLVNTPYLITKLPGDPENSLIGINAPYLMVKVCLEGRVHTQGGLDQDGRNLKHLIGL